MKDEIVDILDSEGKIIGKVSKKEAHENGLLHATVIAEVINKKGEWLLVTQGADRQEPDKFVSPMGGHVSSGESHEEALKREMIEELGISDFTFRHKGKFIYNVFVKGSQENHYFIVYETFSDSLPRLSHEAKEYRYFTLKELKEKLKTHHEIFGNAFKVVLQNLYPELL